jgi:hypothetical protein
MKFGLKVVITLLVLGTSEMTVPNASAQTKLAIHATQAEVDIWKQRAVSGPYKDGWDRIKSKADAFLANPDSRWPGKTTDECYHYTDGTPGRTRDTGLRDAAFTYLLTGNISYRNAARDALLAQSLVPGTDFSNSTRWCGISSAHHDTATWVRILTYGYSYLRASLTAAERNQLDTWFRKAAVYFDNALTGQAKIRFPNRDSNNYSQCAQVCPGTSRGVLYFSGPDTNQFHELWDNQGILRMAMVAAVGATLDDSALKINAKRFFMEWVKYAVWPNGAVFDQMRWKNGIVSHGYLYSAAAIGSALTIADHLARAGDTSLYEFSTTVGMFGTEGGPKSLKKAMQHLAGQTLGTIIEFASTTATSDQSKIIDAEMDETRIDYVFLSNNVFYKDAMIKSGYTKALPNSWASGGYDPRSGDWGTYPDIRFMFGQLEGQVSPFPSGATTSPPVAPSTLTVVPSS